jgi:hypothetical protein
MSQSDLAISLDVAGSEIVVTIARDKLRHHLLQT